METIHRFWLKFDIEIPQRGIFNFHVSGSCRALLRISRVCLVITGLQDGFFTHADVVK